MKKIIYLLLVLFPVMAVSQTQTENYVKTVSYKVATPTVITAPTAAQAAQNITYFDGLGRPIQQIASKQSSSGNDIITHIKYDSFGRQVEEYLPFKSGTTNMAFDPAAETNVLSYYGAPNPAINGNPALEATTNPFSRKELEASPLNRVLKQAAPGNDWKSGSGHEIKIDYKTNLVGEVKLFMANTSWNNTSGLFNIDLISNGDYLFNQLYKTVTYDENTAASPIETAGSTIEFKNKEGQVILKRTYGTVGSDTANQKHDTYYVHDIYGNLTYVIPPKAVDLIGSSAAQADVTSTAVVSSGSSLNLTATNSITLLPGFNAQSGSTFSAVLVNGNQSILDNLCYQYKYDYRNRLVEKKLPGKQWEFLVYDKLDRVVATGPALSPFSDITSIGWSITKYDAFNRPIITGWLPATTVTSLDRKALQENINGLSIFSESKTTSDTALNGVAFRYSNTAWPTVGYHLLTANYFDDYNYPNAPVIPATIEGQQVYYNNTVKPIGLPTGSWVRVLEASTTYRNELSYTLYDAKARPIRTYGQTFLGGYTYADSKLDSFSGRVEYTITRHKRLSTDSELMTKDAFIYSAQDRLLTQTHQINGGSIETVADNIYDELGQLIAKKVGNNIQKIDYTYNIRGWLTAINDVDALSKSGAPKDLFAFRINYNNPTGGIFDVKPLYNGNISETYWATASESSAVTRSYGYRYDNLNRLKDAVFKNGATLANTYNEGLTYDKNGNIQTLKRNGLNGSNVALIDDLVYNYANSNRDNTLMKVVDNTGIANGFKDSASNTADDYSYDANGNMVKDNNKNIAEIKYNHLNLPTKITFASAEYISYLYNAAGQKLQKTVIRTGIPAEITDYLGGYQYLNNSLKFFPTAEGYVEPSGSAYKYVYQYKDHLGNIRLSYDNNLVIHEESNYYPFGLKQEGYNTVKNGVENKYKYNGKELQDELGLNMYDYGARNYDPALGRWMNIDPKAEKMRRHSPYNYAFDNPIYFLDPDGMAPNDWINYTGRNGQQQIIYDSSVKTKAEAEAKGYSNVKQVFEKGTGRSEKTGEVVAFQKGGKFSVNGGSVMDVANGGFTTEGNTYIGKNLTGIEQLASGLQATGDGIAAIGIATGQPEIVAGGEVIGKIGLGIEIGNNFNVNGFNVDTVKDAAIKVGINYAFGKIGEGGISATRNVAGKEFVASGANKVTESVVQGLTMGGEKVASKIIEESRK